MPRQKRSQSAERGSPPKPNPSRESPAGEGESRHRAASQRSAARAHADAMRQAECAAMLIAVTRLLLNMRGRDFATWLRSVADDFETTDLEKEDPDDISEDLIRIGDTEHRSARLDQAANVGTGTVEQAGDETAGENDANAPARRRPH